MDELIGVINDLQSAFAKLGVREKDLNLNMPRIAVVGSQSSGKSSVLESFVGRDFLPRGSGICTRCPLVLQLQQGPKGSEDFAEFGHKPDRKFTDFNEVRDEILRRTTELAGTQVITDQPIMLKVTSCHVLNLTLIDLPGLVQNAVKGQPETIVATIRNMVQTFVSNENTLILAVSAASEDIANSRALDVARAVDKDGRRTLGVLTKLDLMDQGTDAMDTINGNLIKLRHGFIGVVNRSQKDINDNMPVEEAREKERNFFANHPVYGPVANRMGTQYLAKRLNGMLLNHIQECLPALKNHVDELMKQARKKQEQLGMLDEQMREPGPLLLTLINKYTAAVGRSITGDTTEVVRGELYGGARIDYIFHECYAPHVQSLRASSQLSDEYVRLMVRQSSGVQSSLFPSDQVVINLAKQQVRRLEEPSLKCVMFVHDELVKIVEGCSMTVERFPMLRERIIEVMTDLLVQYRTPTQNHVKTMISAEEAYINVKHPAMQEALLHIPGVFGPAAASPNPPPQPPVPQQPALAAQAGQPGVAPGQGPRPGAPAGSPQAQQQLAPQQQQQMQQQFQSAATSAMSQRGSGNTLSFDVPNHMSLPTGLSDKEQRENYAIREMVEAYFTVCKRTACDQVPKILNLLIIRKLQDEMYNKLVHHLYKEANFDVLLAESADIAVQRKATLQMLKCLQVAQDVLGKVRDHPIKRENH